jgi:hypothetical protein
MKRIKYPGHGVFCALTALITLSAPAANATEADPDGRLQQLEQQNRSLQDQLQQQQQQLDELRREVGDMRQAASERETRMENLEDSSDSGLSLSGSSRVRITGEGSVDFFESGSEGMYPNAAFRVGEARLFLDAAIWGDVYGFVNVNMATPESSNVNVQLGEYYLDWEDISKLWDREGQLNLRAGRFYIPFGEEYLTRYAIDNPLISRSLVDLWGVDEGLELYGSAGRFSYVVAVQNGGVPTSNDFNADKAVTGRLGFDAAPWLHLSVSGMRTGNIATQGDTLSEMWFANGWFRSLGSASTTKFHVDMVEGDVALRYSGGHVKAFGGYLVYNDNDPLSDNRREVFYYSVEVMQFVTRRLYGVARFGQVLADNGFPIVGNGQRSDYLFGDLTEDLWRLSLGLGYRLSDRLVIKAEYTRERGREVGGDERNHEDQVATEAAFAF